MSFRARIAAGLVTALAVAGFALTAAPASGTTLTCTNIKNAITSPFGCGGLQTAPGYNGGPFGIRADGNYNNAVIRIDPVNVMDSNQDFHAFPVCENDLKMVLSSLPGDVPNEQPIQTCPGDTTGSVGGLGKYVGMFTPLGNIPQFTIPDLGGGIGGPIPVDPSSCVYKAGSYTNAVPCRGVQFTVGGNTFCLSITKERNGPRHAARWNVILRPCNTEGTFYYGDDDTPGFVTAGFGNAYQEWAPSNGEFGIELANVWVFNHGNIEYTLNVAGNGGAGTHLIAYPLADPTLNESWDGVGCTPPLTSLVAAGQIPASYALCP